jgi:adenylate cyclase
MVATAVTVAIIAIGWLSFSYKTKMPAESVDLSLSVFPSIDKPSLAVLPFENLTGDPQQEYFSDGIADQLITSLSQAPYPMTTQLSWIFTPWVLLRPFV